MAEVNRSSRRSALLRLGILLVLVGGSAAAAALTPLGEVLSREGITGAIDRLGDAPGTPLLFIALYAGATALAMPGSVLTLAGGALFGVFWGTVYNTIAANVGANLAFWVGRALGRDGVKSLAGERLEKLDRATEVHGFRGLLTLRLIPAVPFNALNFGAGLTAIRWPTYAIATLVGIFPGTLVYTVFADALLAGSREASREAFLRVILSGLALVLLSFLPTIARKLGLNVPGGSEERGSATAGSAAALAAVGAFGMAGAGGIAPTPAAGQELVDHAAFGEVLEEVVDAPRVDYAALKADRGKLDAYLAALAEVDPASVAAAGREARLAFWINAYNACMLRLVVDHYPIQKAGGLLARITNAVADRPANSVWQIDDVFTRDHCRVAGAERSQDEIEHEIIRPLGEPRIHFAVNCAARSCPPLRPEPYTADALDAQLDRAVRAFVEDPRHFEIRRDGRPTVRMNKVLDWFKEDFGGEEGLRDFFAPYLAEEDTRLLRDDATRIEFFEYDWTLNDIEP